MTKTRTSSRSSSNTNNLTKTAKTKNSISKGAKLKLIVSAKKMQTSTIQKNINAVKKTGKMPKEGSGNLKQTQSKQKDKIKKELRMSQKTDTAKEKISVRKNRTAEKVVTEKKLRGRKQSSSTKDGNIAAKSAGSVSVKPIRPRKGVSRTRSRSETVENKKKGRKPKNKSEDRSVEREQNNTRSIEIEGKKDIKIDDVHIKTKTIADIIRSSQGIVVDIRKRSRKVNRKKNEKSNKNNEESIERIRGKSKDKKPKKPRESRAKGKEIEDKGTAVSPKTIY